MFSLSDSERFYLYPHPTDMRKSFYTLSGIVTNKMGRSVQDGDAFIFINKSYTTPYGVWRPGHLLPQVGERLYPTSRHDRMGN
jgi:hypothetical protein